MTHALLIPPYLARPAHQSLQLPLASAHPLNSAGPYPSLYTPHPQPKQKLYFGPYLLLQTLGEGEFGKVKLGLHSQKWGEEVAIKLIKRGSVDTKQRGDKVRREIEVLKAVRHPNIVRLYDVIETEKYIGIVLEYASGGELFDHILAHRYLKERDAARLFAQLISGVSYLHAKKIVHRDLKLENLLLSNNSRNVIITDFGFANRFSEAGSDLMATSCGSPCYAAPELVVQEGNYVGTAVDVWSCGVILYAMLSGYLPYDDDPANPEGDNINLLYKYIINTPLTFPDWITESPRHLLLSMLVPDPDKRCTLPDVQAHPWLQDYRPLFEKSTEEMEAIAREEEASKREKLEAQREFLMRQRRERERIEAEERNYREFGGGLLGPKGSLAMAGPMARSQSAMTGMGRADRHKSAIVTSAASPGKGPPLNYQLPSPVTSPRPHSPAILSPVLAAPAVNSNKRRPTSSSTPRTSLSNLAVIPPYQPRAITPLPRNNTVSTSSSASSSRISIPLPSSTSGILSPSSPTTTQSSPVFAEGEFGERTSSPSTSALSGPLSMREKPKDRREVLMEIDEEGGAAATVGLGMQRAALPVADAPTETVEQREKRRRANRATVQVEYDGSAAERRVAVEQVQHRAVEEVPKAASSSSTLAVSQTTSQLGHSIPEEDESAPQIADGDIVMNDAIASPPTPLPTATDAGSTDLVAEVDSPSPVAVAAPAEPTLPVVEEPKSIAPAPLEPALTSDLAPNASAGIAAVTLGAVTVAAAPIAEAAVPHRSKSRRQKAMSLQPSTSSTVSSTSSRFTRTGDSTAGSMGPPSSTTRLPRSSSSGTGSLATAVPRAGKLSGGPGSGGLATPFEGTASKFDASPRPDGPTNSSTTTFATAASSTATPGGKAKMVMDWFRRKSVRADPSAPSSTLSASTSTKSVLEFDRYTPAPSLGSRLGNKGRNSVPAKEKEKVLVPVVPVSSTAKVKPSATLAPPPSLMPFPSPSSVSMSPNLSNFNVASTSVQAKLRVHQGALDKRAVTSRAPAVVMGDVRETLRSLGIDVVEEGEFKLKCVRRRRKKASPPPVINPAPSAVNSVLNASRRMSRSSAASQNPPVKSTGLLAPSPSSTSILSNLTPSPSMSFRSFFSGSKKAGASVGSAAMSRKAGTGGSLALSEISAASSPSLDHVDEPLYSPADPGSMLSSPFLPSTVAEILPIYGSATTTSDSGDEVRFFVELTKVRELNGVLFVEIKRIRGGMWSFKFIYEAVLGSLNLAERED